MAVTKLDSGSDKPNTLEVHKEATDKEDASLVKIRAGVKRSTLSLEMTLVASLFKRPVLAAQKPDKQIRTTSTTAWNVRNVIC
ncbi:hypothetical protein OGAPHI_002121 [Ogataea philodendri]|uniref:Uncharacterized protein n=1 Tax=Ogataea philodendri TaxID=1378263 RepID=A0A9P8PBN6_9ASCO|nr:uncharacterized protein OGAPHI_002121 [Ogataea philodendri]KAH3668367.1 hypothetical protein OGAPHI_002121 [Ogataea philodendri]